MASSITLRNAIFFTKFRRHSAAASINRLFSSTAAGPHDPPIILQGGPKMENLVQMGGPGDLIEVDDGPGLGPDGFKGSKKVKEMFRFYDDRRRIKCVTPRYVNPRRQMEGNIFPRHLLDQNQNNNYQIEYNPITVQQSM